MSAKAIYGVRLTFGIIAYEGEWDNSEVKMEDECEELCRSESKEYCAAFFNRLRTEAAPSTEGPEERKL